MANALLIDFGSTYTKLRAIDLDAGRLIASAQGPSTVTTDVTIGLDAALAALAALERKAERRLAFKHRLASSSAAGGLKMVTVGLVKELTAEAARQAALGAGAKLVGAFAYRLTAKDLDAIAALAPDILLLAGGTDGGNRDVILHNAGALATLRLPCPVVYAGNRDAADDAAAAFARAGVSVIVAGNVMPSFGVLAVEEAQAAIRQVFIDRIVHAKGIDRAAERLDAVLMPTPAAVLDGAQLVAHGASGTAGLGDLMVIDIGGATTDIHSIGHGHPSQDGVVVQGLPEPYAKRTVEGDLGMRHNAHTIVEAVGLEAIAARARLAPEAVARTLTAISADVERLPTDTDEAAVDEALAWAAVRIAVGRHAGSTRIVQTVHGPVTAQTGKDLGPLKTVIGTGGPLANGAAPAGILEAARADPAEPFSLKPIAPTLLVDTHYVLYAAGLLATVAPEAALKLALNSLKPLARDDRP